LAFIQADLKIILKTKVEALNRLYLPLVKNINGKDPWSVFQEAFNKTDKDFLKKMKEAHSI
jgi:hypothetical protein